MNIYAVIRIVNGQPTDASQDNLTFFTSAEAALQCAEAEHTATDNPTEWIVVSLRRLVKEIYENNADAHEAIMTQLILDGIVM